MQFTRTTEIDISALTKMSAYEKASYKVHGFWSGSSIEVIACWTFKELKVDVNWSTGGRDTDIKISNAEAAANFAAALADASEYAAKVEEAVRLAS